MAASRVHANMDAIAHAVRDAHLANALGSYLTSGYTLSDLSRNTPPSFCTLAYDLQLGPITVPRVEVERGDASGYALGLAVRGRCLPG